MENQELIDLLKLRIAVYKLGAKKGLWPCLEDNAAKEYMNYLFPKSSVLALYNLMINVVQKKHEEIVPIDMYNLFKCPIQLEEELFSFLKEHLKDESLFELQQEPMAVLESLATVVCDQAIASVYIGQLSDDLSIKIRVMAFHYKNVFTIDTNCYPFFN